MTATEIRDALHEVAAATTPPPPDRLAFQRAVRTQRRHRRLRGVSAASVAAVAVLAVTAGVQQLPGDGADQDRGAATGTTDKVAVAPPPVPVYFVHDHRLTALDPQGDVHDLGPSEEVLGFTAEGVWAIDDDSQVVWYAVRHGDEGPNGEYTFERAPGPPGVDVAPVTGATSRASVSADGRYLAWMDLEGTVTTYDLKADAVVGERETPENTALVGVDETGLLLSEDGDLWLRGPRDLSIPTAADGYGLSSSLAGDVVAVGDRDGSTRIYDLSGVEARLVDTVDGSGALAPDGERLATLRRNDTDTESVLEVWSASQSQAVTGVAGTPESMQWVDLGSDAATLLVAAHQAGRTLLQSCDGETGSCQVLHVGGEDLRLPTLGY